MSESYTRIRLLIEVIVECELETITSGDVIEYDSECLMKTHISFSLVITGN